MTDTPIAQAPELCGLVLAGGRSRRFGRDKAALKQAGLTWLERTVAVLECAVEEVYVSVRPDQIDEPLRSGFRLIVDRYDDVGPASGLVSAHLERPDAAWLILACDMPFLAGNAIQRLVAARDPQRDATAYRRFRDGAPEPLCAIYEPAILRRFRRQVESGELLSPRALLENADALLIDPPPGKMLSNINTPADLESLRVSADDSANR
jgi:molybdopterin-guanine dinucleotide biosynthesis protein A